MSPFQFILLLSENVKVYKIDHLNFIFLGIVFNISPMDIKTLEKSRILLCRESILITFTDTDITDTDHGYYITDTDTKSSLCVNLTIY